MTGSDWLGDDRIVHAPEKASRLLDEGGRLALAGQ